MKSTDEAREIGSSNGQLRNGVLEIYSTNIQTGARIGQYGDKNSL
jgi:hypothetical protein